MTSSGSARDNFLVDANPLDTLLLFLAIVFGLLSVVAVSWFVFKRRSQSGVYTQQEYESRSPVARPQDVKPVQAETIGRSLSSLKPSQVNLGDISDLSVEALTATHQRQSAQRERFLHDKRNVGLRHMALEQIRIQQIYEEQLMKIKRKK
jgi:hypothetical protein